MMAPETNVQSTQKSNTSVGVNITTKTESTPIGEGLDLNPLYFKTVPGLLKIIQLLLAIICMACGSPVVTRYTHFFMFVVASFFIVTIILCIVYLFTLMKLAPKVPWLIVELLFTASAVFFYIIATIVQLAMTSRRDYYLVLSHHDFYSAYIAAGVMSLFNTVAYGAGLFFLYKDWRESRPATVTSAPNGNAS